MTEKRKAVEIDWEAVTRLATELRALLAKKPHAKTKPTEQLLGLLTAGALLTAELQRTTDGKRIAETMGEVTTQYLRGLETGGNAIRFVQTTNQPGAAH